MTAALRTADDVSRCPSRDPDREAAIGRLRLAVEAVATVNRHSHFRSAATSLCNELAAAWACERVSLGLLCVDHVQLKALSHSAEFMRRTDLVRDLEAAMEECLDQDLEVVHPAGCDATYVSRAAAQLSRRYGPGSIACLPLRNAEAPVAVLLLERDPDRPFDVKELETLRLTVDLCTPRLLDLYERHRGLAAKCAITGRRLVGRLLGADHAGEKLAALAVFLAILLTTLGTTAYHAEGSFVLEATTQRVIVAPFDGYLRSVAKRVGDNVAAAQEAMATMETAELDLERAQARAEHMAYLKQEATAQRDGKTAEAQMARARADEVAARIDLLDYKIRRAVITSDVCGVVARGDLESQLGTPLKAGDVLFEVAQLDSLNAVVSVPDNEVADLAVGQRGGLVTASYPGVPIAIEVTRIDPIAEVVNQRNVFNVHVRLLASPEWLRPGMRGVARIEVGRRSIAWVWTHRLVNWVRMKLWI